MAEIMNVGDELPPGEITQRAGSGDANRCLMCGTAIIPAHRVFCEPCVFAAAAIVRREMQMEEPAPGGNKEICDVVRIIDRSK